MPTTDPRVDRYISNSEEFARPILKHVRELVHSGCPEVEETIKWSFPYFMYKGMLCHMAAFKQHCAFGFWRADLLFAKNGRGIQVKKDAMGQFGRITALSDLPRDPVLLGLIRNAARLNDTRAPSPKRQPLSRKLTVPQILSAALENNRKAAAAFDQFSYSHKKEYVEWILGAKREETRKRRIEMAVEQIAEGRSSNWKYLKR